LETSTEPGDAKPRNRRFITGEKHGATARLDGKFEQAYFSVIYSDPSADKTACPSPLRDFFIAGWPLIWLNG
jgi:hypothetical protein